MVDFKSKIYYEEDNQVVGAEITVVSEEGDNIGSIKISNEEDYNNLKKNLENLDETFVRIDELDYQISQLNIDAATLQNKSSTDFALTEHTHGDIYAPKDHSNGASIYGLGSSSKYGHNKVVNHLNTQTVNDGEALSAYQGKVLSDMIAAEVKKLITWTSQKVGSYGTLKINTQLRCCQFNYTRENYKLNGGATLHEGIIPVAYRPKGVVRVPDSRYTIISINSAGDISLATTYSKTATTTLRINAIWFY